MKTISIATALTILASAAHGAECIDAKAAKAGFILERPGIHSEFRPAAGGMVSVATTTNPSRRRRSFCSAA
ncbi:hypothetical protein [Mesorhizobium sp. L-2-11]|uniref:hypothetical protein n=1 Tax=Mesorhizobium sp. L-2-11 TaxID=2744521 RepID=UPI001FD17F53|nr:hypothetical protein [Mesorhizobium sp. L-2-11]